MHNSNKRIESIGCPIKDENQFRGLLKNSIFSFAIRKGKGLLSRTKHQYSNVSKCQVKLQFTVMSLELGINSRENSEITCPNCENIIDRRKYKLKTFTECNTFRRSRSVKKKEKTVQSEMSDFFELNR